MKVLDLFLFAAAPYIALAIFIIGALYRYRARSFSVSSLSSQFLEGNRLFWGSVPFHVGILVCLLGHLVAFVVPRAVLAFNGAPLRLLILEISALAFALCALVGLLGLLARRLTDARVQVVTTRMDLVVEVLLLAQIVLGIWTAVAYRWGSTWFAADLSPYLWSLVLLSPEIDVASALPPVVKAHIVGAWVLVAVLPFSRLMHLLVAPLHYLARPYQLVLWSWDRRRIRRADHPWSETPPKNN